MNSTRLVLLLLVLLNVFDHKAARAELPSIRFDRIAPLGGEVGTVVEVEILGADIEDVRDLLFDQPGLDAEPVANKERFFNISIASDVPVGTYEVRLVGKWGVSNPRLFAISRGLKNVPEVEPNNDSGTAQLVELNSAVGGMADGNGQDLFRFVAKQGERIVVDCQAGRLCSSLDANLLLTSNGKLIASSSDYHGRDPMVDFVAPHDGEYDVLIHDLSYRGGLPYRLVVTTLPYAENVSPRAVQIGQPTKMTLYGRNLPSSAAESKWRVRDLALQEQDFELLADPELFRLGRYDFREHPSGHSVLATAATCTLTGGQMMPTLSLGDRADLNNFSVMNAQPILFTENAVTNEAEPNNESNGGQCLELPAVVSGRFDQPRDSDWYEIEVSENGQYAFDVYCERINGNADPYLVIMDDQGNRVQELDDFGHRINAFDGHLRDPSGMVQLNEKKKYRVLVQDRYQRGGARSQYVLAIRKAQPDFYVAVIHSQNPGPGGSTIWKGGAIYLDVIVHQREGFNGEITLKAEGLPPGVHAAETVINNNSRGTFVLWADDNAADFTGPIKIVATGRRGEELLTREVRPYSRVDNGEGTSLVSRSLMIAVREKSPYRLEWETATASVEAGKNLELNVKLIRNQTDWQNDVTLQNLAFPGNFQMPNSNFGGSESVKKISISVDKNTRPGAYTLAILGQAQVPFNKDPNSKEKPNTLVSLPSLPLTIQVSKPAE